MGVETNYRIKKLDVKTNFPEFGVVAFIGATSSGKTSLMIDMMYHVRHRFSRVIAICGSKDTEQEFAQHISDLCIWDKFDAERLDLIYNQQERFVFMGTPKPLLVILDDFMYQSSVIKKAEILNRIFMNGRHARILFFVSMQYCKSLLPQMRQQTRMVFMMAEKNPANRVKLYDSFNTCFNDREQFDALMQSLTKDYHAMVLSNMSNSSSLIEDNVFWYRATLGLRFRIAAKGLMWHIHHRRYDPMYLLRGHPEKETAKNSKKKISVVMR